MMRPCCLKTQPVNDIATCKVAGRRLVGGASSYSLGQCPTTAKQAADIEAKRRQSSDGHASQSSDEHTSQLGVIAAAGDDFQLGKVVLLFACLAVCVGLAVVVVVAAQRRPDWRSTPFLHNDGPGAE